VVGERSQISFRQLGERSLEETWSIALKNHKETDIVVKVIERLFRAEDAEIVSASQEYTLTDARTADFDVEVPANDRATVTYSVVYRW